MQNDFRGERMSSSRTTISLAEQLVREQIEHHGPMTFRTFLEIVLYHPRHGYYERSAPVRGRSGDYFTAAQVSPLFPKILADAVMELRNHLGCDQMALIEMGAGDGELLETLLTVLAKENKLKGFRIWAVERSSSARARLSQRLSRFPRCYVVSSLDEVEWMGGLDGCVFSNELIDALPFHRLRYYKSGWQEVYVSLVGGELQEREGPLSSPSLASEWTGVVMPEAHEVEVRPQLQDLFQTWAQALSRGFVLSIDYGASREGLLSPVRAQGSWRCFFQHQVNRTPFLHIGEQDITSQVNFSQMAAVGQNNGFDPLLYCSQGIFLSHVGESRIRTMLESSDPVQKHSTARALQQLGHPDAMGEAFSVFLQAKGMGLPPVWNGIPNRRDRLFAEYKKLD
jgi:SAM-dependent MidA family methyltransferase